VTATPWGDPRELCSQRLKPGPGNARDEVERSQRQRLFAGLVATVAEHGYPATRVADVIERAGVSRNTFYRHFASLYDCLLQTLDAIVAGAEAAMVVQLEGDGPWDERLRNYFEALIDLAVAQPAAARLCFVEAYVAGPEAVGRVDRVARAVGRRALAVVEESPERAGMPPGVARAVLGGLRTVIQIRLYTGRESELPALVPQLMDWALSYRTPPAPLRVPEHPPATPPHPRPHDPDETRGRIVAALTTSVARQSYSRTTTTEIAAAGSMSLTTFYRRFDGKEAAFLAALDDAMLRLLDVSLPAYEAADDWPHGIRDGLETLLAYLASEPDIAKFTAGAVWTGIPAALEHVDERMASFQALLAEGLRQPSRPSDVVPEAIGASILALSYDDLARRGAETLHELAPTAAFVALAPAIGAIEACAIVNGRR
jgi:AcrR family transcriptional regulator